MIDPFDAIERLVAQAQRRTDMNNEKPHRPKITIADTLEAQTAELLSNLVRDRKAPYHFIVKRVDAGWSVAEVENDYYIRVIVLPPAGGVFTSTTGRTMMVNDLGMIGSALLSEDAGEGVKRYEFGA